MQIFLCDLFVPLWDGGKKHTKQWELQAEVNSVSKYAKQGKDTKTREKERWRGQTPWLETCWAFRAKEEWKACRGISMCNLLTLPYFHSQHRLHLARGWKKIVLGVDGGLDLWFERSLPKTSPAASRREPCSWSARRIPHFEEPGSEVIPQECVRGWMAVKRERSATKAQCWIFASHTHNHFSC